MCQVKEGNKDMYEKRQQQLECLHSNLSRSGTMRVKKVQVACEWNHGCVGCCESEHMGNL